MKKNVRIYETLDSVSGLERERTSNGMRLSGVFGVCGVRNNNNRVYEKRNYGKMVAMLQEEIARKHGVMGELEHPNSMNINLNNVSHKIESIQMNEDGTITGSILLLNTSKGKEAQALIEGGLDLYVSSRAQGTIDRNGNVVLENIATYDLVGTPGFSEARVGIAESLAPNQQLECINESLYYIYESDDEDENDDDKDCSDDKNDDKTGKEKRGKSKKNKSCEDGDECDDIDEKIEEAKSEVKRDIKNWCQTALADGIQSWLTEEYQRESNKNIANAVQSWITEEYQGEMFKQIAEGVERWITEEYQQEANRRIQENIKHWMLEEFAPSVEKWIVEEFAPEVENWVVEEFAPEVQNWITEEYSPTLEKWIVEEYGAENTRQIAEGIEQWTTEELVPVIDKWVNEEVCTEIYNNVNDYIVENKKTSLDTIDSMLNMIDESNAGEVVNNMVNESQNQFKDSKNIVLESMPDSYKPLWNMCSEAKQEEILQRAKMYNFLKEGVADKFWATVDFTSQPRAEVEARRNVNENYTAYQNAVRNMLGRFKKY